MIQDTNQESRKPICKKGLSSIGVTLAGAAAGIAALGMVLFSLRNLPPSRSEKQRAPHLKRCGLRSPLFLGCSEKDSCSQLSAD